MATQKPWEQYATLYELVLSFKGQRLTNAHASRICMQFLMRKQYRSKPPSLCPCY